MEPNLIVKLYAPFSDLAGARQVGLSLAEPTTARELIHLLGQRYPRLAPHLAEDRPNDEAVLLVVNGRLAEPGDAVRPGDEVFLCPQISGG